MADPFAMDASAMGMGVATVDNAEVDKAHGQGQGQGQGQAQGQGFGALSAALDIMAFTNDLGLPTGAPPANSASPGAAPTPGSGQGQVQNQAGKPPVVTNGVPPQMTSVAARPAAPPGAPGG